MPEGDLSDIKKQYPNFNPAFTPKQMLEMGVFEGKYMRDCHHEFPSSWFTHAKEAKGDHRDPSLNYFGLVARKSLKEWGENGWIYGNDPRGWMQWWCRLYYGRREPEIDKIQINRWLSIKRHVAQIQAACKPGDMECRPRQRQTLLQWSYPINV
jgi:hypothetical protein